MYTTGQLCKKAGITNHTLQSWMKRHPDLIECTLSSGGHRRFPLKTVMQLAAAKQILDRGFSDARLALKAGIVFSDSEWDVRINDKLVLEIYGEHIESHLTTYDWYGPGLPRPLKGLVIDLTDLHNVFYGPHQERPTATEFEERQRYGREPVKKGVLRNPPITHASLDESGQVRFLPEKL